MLLRVIKCVLGIIEWLVIGLVVAAAVVAVAAVVSNGGKVISPQSGYG